MVNLGREDEAWLIGPRGREWFTGLEPNICPGEGNIFATANDKKFRMHFCSSDFLFLSYTGVDEKGILRSLPLPNLSNVTRQGTMDYFDNSWTLFEMLFAGLKGEEPFYRCVDLRLSRSS